VSGANAAGVGQVGLQALLHFWPNTTVSAKLAKLARLPWQGVGSLK